MTKILLMEQIYINDQIHNFEKNIQKFVLILKIVIIRGPEL